MTQEQVSYRFGPLERRGLLGPFSVGQVTTVAVALMTAVLLLDLAPGAGGAILGLTLVVGAGALAMIPIHGRPLVGWLPVFGRFSVRGLRGSRSFSSEAPTAGAPAPGSRVRVHPRELKGVELISMPYRAGTIGALLEKGNRSLTAVLACEVRSFQLLDPPAQERRLAQWGSLLSGAAGTPIRRLQWIERTAPAEADALAGWLHAERDPVLGERGSPLMESYLELIDSTAPVIHSHELLLAIQLDTARVRGPASAAPTALIEQTEQTARALEAGEVKVLGALSAGQLASTLRTAFDPYARGDLSAHRATGRTFRPTLDAAAPLARTEEWDHVRNDGALHATYWIAGWPRIDVASTFMSALLNPSAVVRTVSVTFEPLSAERSTREVEAAITRDRADRELRARFGQSETARQRQAQESALRREAELAAGHGEVRFSGFITVSGRDPDELRRACQETQQHAAAARLELRRMYGQQAEAFTFTLPLGRGLA